MFDESAEISTKQWRDLTRLHRALLHQYHTLFHALCSQGRFQWIRRFGLLFTQLCHDWALQMDRFLAEMRRREAIEPMLEYLNDAYGVLERLRRKVPALDSQWIECLVGLDIYRDELVRTGRVPPDSIPKSWVGDMGTAPPTGNMELARFWRSSPGPFGVPMDRGIAPPSPAFGASNYHDDSLWSAPPSQSATSGETGGGPSGPEKRQRSEGREEDPRDSRKQLLAMFSRLSDVALLVLAGWLLVGQGASSDFNIYVKVFFILLLPAV